MVKKIYAALAGMCVALGIAGTFVPLLPTTPFLLLAIFLYMRSSKKGVKMILRNKYLSPYVKSYFSKKGIPVRILLRTLLLMWGMMAACAIWATDNIYVRILLAAIAIGVTIHLYHKREKPGERKPEGKKRTEKKSEIEKKTEQG